MTTKAELSPWLAGVYVKEEFRKQGIGKKLVAGIEKLAKKLSFKSLYLYTPDKETFYNALEWKTIERIEYKNTKVVIMKKNI